MISIFLKYIFYYNFKILTKEECLKKNLTFENNIYGDGINIFNCRSIWIDEYDFRYRCKELAYEEDF